MKTHKSATFVRSQRGVSLIVVLILLLVVTLLGLAILRTTVLEERMSANLFDRSLSFQAAETALREAENDILQAQQANITVRPNWGNCLNIVCETTPPADAVWTTASTATQSPLSPGAPQYYVQYLGQYTNADKLGLGNSINSNQYGGGGATALAHYYRIFARSHNPAGSDRSSVLLQSNYTVE